MIESQILPAPAVQYLDQLEQAKNNTAKEISLFGAKTELLTACVDFVNKSEIWRRASHEFNWVKFQRNADGIYDPALTKKKETWQSRVHVTLTAAHRETIHAHVFKVMVGTNPPLEIAARHNLGKADQSENIRDIILREIDKAQWAIVIDNVLHDADTFGSGFLRMSYRTTIEKRKLRKEINRAVVDDFNPMGMEGYLQQPTAGQIKREFSAKEEDVIVYRGLDLRHCSIWDIFPDPKALSVKGSTIAYRFYLSYEQIIKGIQAGHYMQSAAEELKNEKSTRRYSQGEAEVQSNRAITDGTVEQTSYQRELELFELFGRMPKKWIYPIIGEDFTNGEELVPARIIFHKKALVAVEINDDYEGEPQIYKMDYFPRNGSFYGVGIPEMLQAPQDIINEIVNQRLDNGAQALNHSFAVIEKALVNPKQDLVSKPATVIRLDSKYVSNGVAANAITTLPINDTPLRAGFTEVNEAERWAQERTSANRVTLGTAGLVNDMNQTLGGQQILRESAGEKFAYIGLRIELGCLLEFFRGIWKTIYNYIEIEDIEESIGKERAQNFILVHPEEINRDYVYRLMGIFTMENKSMRQAQLMQIRQNFLGAPWMNDEAFFDAAFQNFGENPEKFKKTEQQILQEQTDQIQPGLGEIPLPAPENTLPLEQGGAVNPVGIPPPEGMSMPPEGVPA